MKSIFFLFYFVMSSVSSAQFLQCEENRAFFPRTLLIWGPLERLDQSGSEEKFRYHLELKHPVYGSLYVADAIAVRKDFVLQFSSQSGRSSLSGVILVDQLNVASFRYLSPKDDHYIEKINLSCREL